MYRRIWNNTIPYFCQLSGTGKKGFDILISYMYIFVPVCKNMSGRKVLNSNHVYLFDILLVTPFLYVTNLRVFPFFQWLKCFFFFIFTFLKNDKSVSVILFIF